MNGLRKKRWRLVTAALGILACQSPTEGTQQGGDLRERPQVTGVGDAGPPELAGLPAQARGPASARVTQGLETAEEHCLDLWLQAQNLDPFGGRPGTKYPGGTPLYDERTGRHIDRRDFVFARHPKAREACRTPARLPSGLPTE